MNWLLSTRIRANRQRFWWSVFLTLFFSAWSSLLISFRLFTLTTNDKTQERNKKKELSVKYYAGCCFFWSRGHHRSLVAAPILTTGKTIQKNVIIISSLRSINLISQQKTIGMHCKIHENERRIFFFGSSIESFFVRFIFGFFRLHFFLRDDFVFFFFRFDFSVVRLCIQLKNYTIFPISLSFSDCVFLYR